MQTLRRRNPNSRFPRIPKQKIITCVTHNDDKEGSMKSYRMSLGLWAAVIMATNSPVLAHEECDEVPQAQLARSAQAGSAESQERSQITIKLFHHRPGRVQVKPGTTVTWVNEDGILHTIAAALERN
jgi:hypothetical protein